MWVLLYHVQSYVLVPAFWRVESGDLLWPHVYLLLDGTTHQLQTSFFSGTECCTTVCFQRVVMVGNLRPWCIDTLRACSCTPALVV